MRHNVLFLTERSPRHQQDALKSAPSELAITMLRRPSPDELRHHLVDAEFLISERAGEIDAALIGLAPRLRLIQRLGSLTYDIDVVAAQQAGVVVCAWPILGCILVAEHMVMQMLALAKRLPEAKAIAESADDWGRPSLRTDENIFAYNWSGRTDVGGIDGATVGILGFGEIGAELTRRLLPFRPARIYYYKRRRLPLAVEQALGLTYAESDELIAGSDFLCSLLPYYAQTNLSINTATFANMKRGAYIVHCGSGSVIDEAALAAAIVQGHLGGAALDTFEYEPIRADNPLRTLAHDPTSNLLLTPHTAAGAARKDDLSAHNRQSDYTNILRLLAGQPLLYQATAE